MKAAELNIQGPDNARFRYVTRFIFSDCLDIPYYILASDELPRPGCPILNYSTSKMEGAVNIYSCGLLNETGIREINPDFCRKKLRPFVFPAPDGFDLPLDLFGAVFFMISRYEEYLPFKPDRFGRFEAEQSFAGRHDFCEEPVVDQWIMLLEKVLLCTFPDLHIPSRTFRYLSTFDVDSPWAYLNKSWLRATRGIIGAAVKMDADEIVQRMEVLGGKIKDPYDTYDYIEEMESQYGFRSVFFLLSGNKGRYDINYALETMAFRNLIRRLSKGRTVGIHPSYHSNHHEKKLKPEFERFSQIFGKQPYISRQHYLMLQLPETYKRLEGLGIQEDYSMGFASYPGFRAGTCTPFRFYDLPGESERNLTIVPFAVMDVTLRQYLRHTPEEALYRIEQLIEKVKAVNGTFTSVWHNESLSDYGVWKGWRNVFEGMVKRVMDSD
jgi:hypothetical protein